MLESPWQEKFGEWGCSINISIAWTWDGAGTNEGFTALWGGTLTSGKGYWVIKSKDSSAGGYRADEGGIEASLEAYWHKEQGGRCELFIHPPWQNTLVQSPINTVAELDGSNRRQYLTLVVRDALKCSKRRPSRIRSQKCLTEHLLSSKS